jgi:hypothetical protein
MTFDLAGGRITIYQGLRTYIFELAKDFEDEVSVHASLEQLEILARKLLDFASNERGKL